MIQTKLSLAERARWLGGSIRTVPINRCYHYRGFRYGGFGNNLYEDYIVGLALGSDKAALRSKFAHAVLTHRPKTMSEMLGIDVGDPPMWVFPWTYSVSQRTKQIHKAEENPDVICHYCEEGILASHVNREFGWLDQALANISENGYLPDKHGYITCIELRGENSSSYLVLDGNHRISALHATGATEIAVRLPLASRVTRSHRKFWPGVLLGTFGIENAARIFDRYFWPQNPGLQPINPASLIIDEAPLWTH